MKIDWWFIGYVLRSVGLLWLASSFVVYGLLSLTPINSYVALLCFSVVSSLPIPIMSTLAILLLHEK